MKSVIKNNGESAVEPVGDPIIKYEKTPTGPVLSISYEDDKMPVGGALVAPADEFMKKAQERLDFIAGEGCYIEWDGGLCRLRYPSGKVQYSWHWCTDSAIDALRAAPAGALVAKAEQHPDDVAVDRFAVAMKEKMAKSRAKGRGGWNDPAQCSVETLQDMLLDHLAKRDPVDIGNFAMMLWNRGAPVSAMNTGLRDTLVAAFQSAESAAAPILHCAFCHSTTRDAQGKCTECGKSKFMSWAEITGQIATPTKGNGDTDKGAQS